MTAAKPAPVAARRVFADPVLFLAFGFGTGLAPRAPGTAGSLPGLLIAWFCAPLEFQWKIAVLVAMLVAGVVLCGAAARRIGVHDHPGIVWDEMAGMFATLLVVPQPTAAWVVAFGLFRLFDIWKPWPIRDLDHRMTGGAGIMLDDVFAALYAASLLAFGEWLIG